jgi:hypothetical protein
VDETGMLFSEANLRRSCRPWNFSQNSGSRQGAIILMEGLQALKASSKRTWLNELCQYGIPPVERDVSYSFYDMLACVS